MANSGRAWTQGDNFQESALTGRPFFAFSTPEIRRLFFQSLPQFFHTTIFREPAPDKVSALHWNCQPFFFDRPWRGQTGVIESVDKFLAKARIRKVFYW
jgi:hypothetical protein